MKEKLEVLSKSRHIFDWSAIFFSCLTVVDFIFGHFIHSETEALKLTWLIFTIGSASISLFFGGMVCGMVLAKKILENSME